MSADDIRALSSELKELLGLAINPIAITFRETPAAGIEAFHANVPSPTADGRTGAAPAGCVFWIESANRTFSTVPSDHYNCSVGCVTHGMKTLAEVAQNADIQAVCEAGWVSPEIFPKITAVRTKPEFVIYGPANETSEDPSVILIRLNGKQQMFLHDAWPEIRIEGKPQCHIVAIAKEVGEVAMSVGCMLSRVRTGMSNNEVTCAIPPAVLPRLIERLRGAKDADARVAMYAAQDAKRFGREQTPPVMLQ